MLTNAKAVLAHYPVTKGALLLMGHGTAHIANMIYPAMQTAFRILGADNVFVGTVEGWPELSDVIHQLKRGGFKKVELAPFMLVAGDHAGNDMAGNTAGSWKNILKAEGFEVSCHMEGIGQWQEIGEMYARKAKEADEGRT